jgi:hypothetical protein
METGLPDRLFFFFVVMLSLQATAVMKSHVSISVSFFLPYFIMLSAAQIMMSRIWDDELEGM